MIRKPAVAGMFYPNSREELGQMIDDMLKHVTNKKIENLRAIIVPHAGYTYSGEVAAHAYALLDSSIKKVILLGPAHHVYMHDIATDDNDMWETPLGKVKVADSEFVRSKEAHNKEHCLEVQIPFLQKALKDFEILPLVAGDADPKLISKRIIKILDSALLVISSDLSHFHDYNTAKKLDNNIIGSIEKLDYTATEEGEACGIVPILTAIDIAKKLNWKCKLLNAKNSGDVTGDRRSVVGYASFALSE